MRMKLSGTAQMKLAGAACKKLARIVYAKLIEMARAFIVLFSLFIVINTYASNLNSYAAPSIRYELSAQPPEVYSLAEAIDHIESLSEFANDKSGLFDLFDRGLPDDFDARGANCNSFIKEDSSYGPHGISIRNAFLKYTNPKHINRLLQNESALAYSMPQLCPKYASFDFEGRVRFWVWTMAAIAWEEATCRDGAINRRGTNDVAVGLLQLEKTKSKRYWRGPLCNVAEVAIPAANLNCGLEIMRGQFDGTYGSPAGLSIPNSYWQRLRTKWSKIDYLISLFPGCA